MMQRQNAQVPEFKSDGSEWTLVYTKTKPDRDITTQVSSASCVSTGLFVYVDGKPVELYKQHTEGKPTFHKYYIFVECSEGSSPKTIRKCSMDEDGSFVEVEQRNVGQAIRTIMRENSKYGVSHLTLI
jgi:hypothetical protein